MTDTTIRVRLGERSYDIEIGSGNLPQSGPWIASRVKLTQALIVTDSNVEKTHAAAVRRSVEGTGARVDVVSVLPGEQSKSVAMLNSLWERFLEAGADRKSVVIAVGGGVIGDLAGFAAASFVRGLSFFQVPTTLLAQVDSSVGGKVGINLPSAKNMVGAFWQPRGVMIDTDVLATLPEREFRAGLAEVVKYGVILDDEFFVYLEQNARGIENREPATLRHIVARSCRLKADVVENDEREETGLRAVLNYGHTFCHAIESLTGYGKYLHGEAVAIGMNCAARLAELLHRVGPELRERQRVLLERLCLPTAIAGLDADEMIAAMRHDKKVAHGKLRFVLPTRIGHVELVADVPEELVRQAIQDCR